VSKTIEIKTRNGPESHVYFTQEEADEIGCLYEEDWRAATKAGQRVLTDDGWVVPVLKVYDSDGNKLVRIPTGTFQAKRGKQMDTEKRQNRFNLSGVEDGKITITNRVRVFAFNVANQNQDPFAVHEKIWPNMAPATRVAHLNRLLRNEEVRELMRKELKEALKTHGVDDSYVIQKLKGLVEQEEVSDRTVLDVLDRMIGLIDRTEEKQGEFHGINFEEVREQIAGGQERIERREVSLVQGVSSAKLIGEEPDLDASQYEDSSVKEETLEDRDAEDDAVDAV